MLYCVARKQQTYNKYKLLLNANKPKLKKIKLSFF